MPVWTLDLPSIYSIHKHIYTIFFFFLNDQQRVISLMWVQGWGAAMKHVATYIPLQTALPKLHGSLPALENCRSTTLDLVCRNRQASDVEARRGEQPHEQEILQ